MINETSPAPLQVSIYMCNEVVLVENEEFKSYSFCSLIHHKLDQKLIAANETYIFVISCTSIKYIKSIYFISTSSVLQLILLSVMLKVHLKEINNP